MAPPALLTRTCSVSPPAAASSATEAREVTSQVTAVPPTSPASAATRSARRAAHHTAYPSRASARAVAAPIPLLAPVTTAVRRLTRLILPRRADLGSAGPDRRRQCPVASAIRRPPAHRWAAPGSDILGGMPGPRDVHV